MLLNKTVRIGAVLLLWNLIGDTAGLGQIGERDPDRGREEVRIKSIDVSGESTVSLEWDGTEEGVIIDWTLSVASPWEPIPGISFPVTGGQWQGSLPGEPERAFFRIQGVASGDTRKPMSFTSSPKPGEDDVAVTRETILRFSSPINSEVTVTGDMVQAAFGGETLETRIEVGAQRETVTLFYNNPLPSSAKVNVIVDGDALLDKDGRALDADGDGTPGGTGRFWFETLSLTTLPNTAVVGRVFASELAADSNGEQSVNVPLEGATITVDGREEELRAVTDASGNFRLEPAPAGRFFVHIDGRTGMSSTPDGAYYPFVGKAWQSVPGEEVDVGNIYLPLITDGTLQEVSQTESTEVTFPDSVINEHPELQGVKLEVPPDALYADDGARGGKVGIAPVPPDRIPGELPPGLDFPLVITVQTDGPTNFDQPVPACFPNLPDPETGEKLKPGEKTALWSFNHDTGRFEIMGSMTVSDDGERICTDPGVGIEAPGWHGTNPGTEPPPVDPPDDPCEVDAQSCAPSAILGGMECALSFIPVKGAAGCAFGVARGTLSFMRDAPTGDGVDRAVGGGAAALGIAEACSKAIPIAGQVISCGGAGISIVKNCSCIGRTTASARGGGRDAFHLQGGGAGAPFALSQSSSETVRAIEASLDVMRAYKRYYDLLLGSEVWTDAVDLDEGDPRREIETFWALMDEVVAVVQAESDEAQLISASEETELIAHDRPSGITEQDVANLVDYLNQTTRLWRQGTLTHDAAGRADFIDHDAYIAAIDGIEAALDAYQAVRGASDDDKIALQAPFADLYNVVQTSLAEGGGSEFEVEGLFYALVDETNGFTQRGRLTGAGTFEQRAIRANAFYRAHYLDPQTFAIGNVTFVSAAPGEVSSIPDTTLHSTAGLPDEDGDGLPDKAEFVVGTDPTKADTSGDGVNDADAIRQGLDPLGENAPRRGLTGTADTSGEAVDVDVWSGLAAVADLDAGISVFNVFNGMTPTMIAQVETPGSASRVAGRDDHLAVADDVGGLLLFDVTDPSAPSLAHQLRPAGEVTCVALAQDVAFAGTSMGELIAMEVTEGRIRYRVLLPQGAHDLAIRGDFLYVLTIGEVHAIDLKKAQLVATASSPGNVGAGSRRLRLFVGDEVLYATHTRGYNTIDISEPAEPTLIAAGSTQQFGWKQMVPMGSSVGLAAVSANSTDDGDHNVSLYDLSNPSETDVFLTSFETPGLAEAIAAYKGRAYVADREAGLQVLNFAGLDTAGNAPSVSLETGLEPADVAAGSREWLLPNASDDVGVSRVDYLLDGEKIGESGRFPFEHRFRVPTGGIGSSITFQARATDLAGNATLSEVIERTLVEDDEVPGVRIGQAVAGAPFSVNAVTIPVRVAATDNVGVTDVRFEIDGSAVDVVSQEGDWYEIESPGIVGTFEVVAIAEDAAGLMGRSEVTPIELVPEGDGSEIGIGMGGPILDRLVPEAGMKTYFLRAEAGQRLMFEVQGSDLEQAAWRLKGPGGETLFESPMVGGFTRYRPERVDIETDGLYRLQVESDQAAVEGAYRFRVWELPAPDEFAIGIGDVASSATLGAGAGELEQPGAIDIYRFTAQAGQRVFVEILEGPALDFFEQIEWKLVNEEGDVVFDDALFENNHPGRITLQEGGEYQVVVGTADSRVTGRYAFQIWGWPPPVEYDIAMGDAVSDGVPAEGAGRIEPPKDLDVYRFQAEAGETIFLETTEFDFSAGLLSGIQWVLENESGDILLEELFSQLKHAGRIRLEQGGQYTLTIGSKRFEQTGTYGFKLWHVPEPDRFEIAVGDMISMDEPGGGAGRIETPGARDIYTLNASAGQSLFFRVVSTSLDSEDPFKSLQWRLESPSGEELFNMVLHENVDPGKITLEQEGVYKLIVGSQFSPGTGSYSIEVTEPGSTVYDIAIGDIVSENDPGQGAGNIESVGEIDRYVFQADAGQRLFLLVQETEMSFVEMELSGPEGEMIFDSQFVAGSGPGVVPLENAGTYELKVGSASFDFTGTYQFQTWDVPMPDEFEIAIGDTVSEGDPGPGAGNIESPGAQDIYSFEGSANQSVTIEVLSPSLEDGFDGSSFLNWRLDGPDGNPIGTGVMFSFMFTQPITLPADGTYRLIVNPAARTAITGTYSFRIQ